MVKKVKTFESEMIRKNCIEPANKQKKQAIKEGNLTQANISAAVENYCRIEEDKSKKKNK